MNIEKNRGDETFAKYLRYAATALSLVSFLTTAAGMDFIVGKGNNWKGFLISFGIQAIVLVIGLKFFEINAALKTRLKSGWKVLPLSVIILSVFICAVGFSSFFSYVFLSNATYHETKLSDYNIDIDQFLTKETKSLRDYNDVTGNKILQQMRSYLSSFDKISSTIQNKGTTSVAEIVKNADLKENKTTIEVSDLIDEKRIAAFRGRYQDDGWYREEHIAQLELHNKTFKTFQEDYTTTHDVYESYYDTVTSDSFNPEQAKTLIPEITVTVAHIENQITELEKVKDNLEYINNVLITVRAIITSKYYGLNNSLNQIKAVCDQVANGDTHIEEMAEFNLNDITRILYSPETVKDSEIDDAIKKLETLVTFYLQTKRDDESNNILQDVSAFIIYLGEFKNYRLLEQEIKEYEENNLRQRYVIVSNPTAEVEKQWKEERRADIEEFIKLLKTLPNADLLDRAIKGQVEKQSSIFTEADLSSYRDYMNVTLDKAYKIEREKFDELNEVEQAILFMTSSFPVMAVICIPIALFLDLTSFGIGIFLFFLHKKGHQSKMDSGK